MENNTIHCIMKVTLTVKPPAFVFVLCSSPTHIASYCHFFKLRCLRNRNDPLRAALQGSFPAKSWIYLFTFTVWSDMCLTQSRILGALSSGLKWRKCEVNHLSLFSTTVQKACVQFYLNFPIGLQRTVLGQSNKILCHCNKWYQQDLSFIVLPSMANYQRESPA